MKKIVIILIVACITSTSIFAQKRYHHGIPKYSIGILGGLNIPDLTGGGDNPLSSGWSSRKGEAFGITGTFNLGSNLSLRADILYSSEGGKHDGMQAINASTLNPMVPAGTYFYADFHNESILNYLEIPVMIKYKIPVSKISSFYADLGPYAGMILNAKQKTSGSSIVYADEAGMIPVSFDQTTGNPVQIPFDANTDITDDIKTFNFGLTGGIGFSQGVGLGDISLEIRGAYGLTTIQKNIQNGSSHTGNLLFALIYSIPFKL
jgi:hypothetical protein